MKDSLSKDPLGGNLHRSSDPKKCYSWRNRKMNEYLKELCELMGIDSPVTQTYYRSSERIEETVPKYALIGTHFGQRTFTCNALMLGIPPQVVMKWTGHKDYSAMRPYKT